MNDKNKTPASPANAADKPVITRPTGLVNLMAKYPQYNGGDARVAKVGTKGAPVHGYMLGFIDLPKTIKDPATGELKDWTGIVIELLQPAPADDPNGEEDADPIYYPKGTRIIMTVSKVLEKPEIRAAAEHPRAVLEVYIEPVVSKTKEGRSLWTYPVFDIGRPIPRLPTHQVGNAALAAADALFPPPHAAAPQLPAPTNAGGVPQHAQPATHTA